MFEKDKIYRRRDLHDLYGGQEQGGISTPQKHPFIMLFTGEGGEQYGYADRPTKDGGFLYVGEGRRGDMTFKRGNRAIRDHVSNGKDLHLFEYVEKGQVRYRGSMVYMGHRLESGRDQEGRRRQTIVFELSPRRT